VGMTTDFRGRGCRIARLADAIERMLRVGRGGDIPTPGWGGSEGGRGTDAEPQAVGMSQERSRGRRGRGTEGRRDFGARGDGGDARVIFRRPATAGPSPGPLPSGLRRRSGRRSLCRSTVLPLGLDHGKDALAVLSTPPNEHKSSLQHAQSPSLRNRCWRVPGLVGSDAGGYHAVRLCLRRRCECRY
jgi:hypothetical protein